MIFGEVGYNQGSWIREVEVRVRVLELSCGTEN